MSDARDDPKERARPALECSDMDLALQRTQLANERTFSAWIRTGIAAVVAGLGVAQFITLRLASWVPRAIGAILILTGGGFFIIALWRYMEEYRAERVRGATILPIWIMATVILALMLIATLALFLVVV